MELIKIFDETVLQGISYHTTENSCICFPEILDIVFGIFFKKMSEFATHIHFSDPLTMRLYYNIAQSAIVVKFLVTRALSLVRQCQN